ncbi:hypothetical protein [Halococcoides cellulosivorans]|uniref:Uncharacterized protein n=1 Tax=Halococcoides cellulosivorans TaxID=1679096 RepID=A0A2R4WZV0_9EURY|nr:hypothetical protein [Halococcoides cellulosivorans]AWB27057.1 hypothetical protein HARCEL1_04715 [Halococcoides cellulosivorans]
MTLDELTEDVESTYAGVSEETTVSLDRETRMELAMLETALGTPTDSIVERAVHQLFQRIVDTGRLDFHLRSEYDVTYDEYLAGQTFGSEFGADDPLAATDDDRRYQF